MIASETERYGLRRIMTHRRFTNRWSIIRRIYWLYEFYTRRSDKMTACYTLVLHLHSDFQSSTTLLHHQQEVLLNWSATWHITVNIASNWKRQMDSKRRAERYLMTEYTGVSTDWRTLGKFNEHDNQCSLMTRWSSYLRDLFVTNVSCPVKRVIIISAHHKDCDVVLSRCS